MIRNTSYICAIVTLIIVSVNVALADVPQLISFQGKLHDNAGNPLTGQYEITFRLYNVESGGNHVWTETSNVSCENGLYNVILGLTTPMTLGFDGEYWLSIQVSGDDELSPRFRIVSVPVAIRAAVADSALRVSWNSLTDVPDGFADGTDDVCAAGGVSQINSGTGITVTNPTGPTATVSANFGTGGNQVAAGNHTHDVNYVNEGQANSITSGMIVDGTIQQDDLAFSPAEDNDWLMSGDDMSAAVSGNVGIGTMGPLEKLHIEGISPARVRISTSLTEGSRSAGFEFANKSKVWGIDVRGDKGDALVIRENMAERLTIKPDGNVGIGTTSPNTKLDINGTAQVKGFKMPTGASAGHVLVSDASGVGSWQTPSGGTDGHSLDAADGDPVDVVYVNNNGSVGIGTVTPHEERMLHIHSPVSSIMSAVMLTNEGTGSMGTDGLFIGINTAGDGFIHNREYGTLQIFTGDSEGISIFPNGNVGIDVPNNADQKLTVNGTVHMRGFKMETGASAGCVLVSDASGFGTWQTPPAAPDGDWTVVSDNMYSAVSGRVGIGTTSPGVKFHVKGDIYFQAIFESSTSSGGIKLKPDIGDEWEIQGTRNSGTPANAFIVYNRSDNQYRLVIDDTGDVGIGYTSPSYKLDVNGTIRGANIVPSDARLKREIVPIEGALEKVNSLRGVNFRWQDEEKPDELQMGVIAQEVEEVFPEAVSTDDEGYKSVAYEKLVAPLIEAIKDLKVENESLKQRIGALETKGQEKD